MSATIKAEWIELLDGVIPGLRKQEQSSDEGESAWASEEISRYFRCARFDGVEYKED